MQIRNRLESVALIALLNSIAVSLVFALSLGCLYPAVALGELPSASLKIPPMTKENSVSTYVPSDAAPGQGLAVNIIYPVKPRYKEGAPVMVVVPGGNSSSGLDFSMHGVQQGFVEVRFAFPGGGKEGFKSSGIYDGRGFQSREALKDVFRFAKGELNDHQGKSLAQLLPVPVYQKNVGSVGWSNGGNVLISTLATYPKELQFVSWLAFYESPLGAIFFPPALGGAQDLIANPHYRPGTAATGNPIIDFSKLMFQTNVQKSPGAHKKVGESEIPGVLFFDENDNKIWEESREFAFSYCTDIGLEKQLYAPTIVRGLLRNAALSEWPSHIATEEESKGYFSVRDGSLFIQKVAENFPNLLVTIFASRLDHLQRQNDHPHIALQYNAWLERKPKFLRLNPDPVYVASVAEMRPGSFVDNAPGAAIDSDSIDQHLETEGMIPDYAYMEAAAAELADRLYTGKIKATLEAPLVPYLNPASKPVVPAAPKPSF